MPKLKLKPYRKAFRHSNIGNRETKRSVLSTTPSIVQVGSQQQADDFDHLIDHNYPVSFVFPASPSSPHPPENTEVSETAETNTSSTAYDLKKSPEDNEYLSTGSSDCKSDTDDEYVCSGAEDSCESEDQISNNERKFIVFESQLDQLFSSCKTCASICEVEKIHNGRMVTVKTICSMNHTCKWTSQLKLIKYQQPTS